MSNELSVEKVLQYFITSGGKVTNRNIVKHFRSYLRDPQTKEEVQKKFKFYINQIANPKIESGVKYLILKDKYAGQLQQRRSVLAALPPNHITPKKVNNISPVPSTLKHKANNSSTSVADVQLRPDPSYQLPTSPRIPLQNATSVGSKNESCASSNTVPSTTEQNSTKQNDTRSGCKPACFSEEAFRPKSEKVVPAKLKRKHPPKTAELPKEEQFEEASQGTKSSIDKKEAIEKKKNKEETDSKTPNKTRSQPIRKPVPKAQKSQNTEWIVAAACNDYNVLAQLAEANPEVVQVKDIFTNYSALHWAAKHGNLDTVKLLVGKYKANTNTKSKGGYTPLHLAAQHRHTFVYDLLVKDFDACPDIQDFYGKTPQQYMSIGNDMPEKPESTELKYKVPKIKKKFNIKKMKNTKIELFKNDTPEKVNSEETENVEKRFGMKKMVFQIPKINFRKITKRRSLNKFLNNNNEAEKKIRKDTKLRSLNSLQCNTPEKNFMKAKTEDTGDGKHKRRSLNKSQTNGTFRKQQKAKKEVEK